MLAQGIIVRFSYAESRKFKNVLTYGVGTFFLFIDLIVSDGRRTSISATTTIKALYTVTFM